MNIVILCRRLDGKPLNGFDRYAHNLVEGLSKSDVEITLPNQNPFVNVKPSGSIISPPFYDIIMPLWYIIKGAKGDVFHAITDGQAIVFPLLKGKKIVTMHHVDKTPPIGIKEKIFRYFYALGTKISVKYADMIICISEQTKEEVIMAYGIDENRLAVVPHAVSKKFYAIPDAKKENIVGYVGALKNRKNLEFLIRTAAAYRDKYPEEKVSFQICGEGPELERLTALRNKLQLNHMVEFKGRIADEEIVEKYNSFSLFCLPSFQEGFGLPVIEAERCGVPVLTVKGAMMPSEVTGAAIECSDEECMASEIHRLLSDDAAYAAAVDAAKKHADQYSIERMASATNEIYHQVFSCQVKTATAASLTDS